MQPEAFGGRYHVLRPIGRGGMGTVWLCRDETLARAVAVKQVGRLPGDSDTDTARAIREARSTAALNHRNVVTVFDVLQEDGSIWLVMEHVPSRSLSQVIREEGRLSPARTAALGAQVADGLAAAHAAGITHRDVKPGNILVTADGLAKIGDFGISRTAGEPALTQSDLVTGTPSYFSPELARGSDPAPASDVWALGATLYAAVEGRPLYQPRDNPVAVLHEIANRPPPAPRHAGPLERVLTRMLDRDPATRWSMEDVAHALHRIADRAREDTTAFTEELPTAPAALGGVPPTEPDPRPHQKTARPAATAAEPSGAQSAAASAPRPVDPEPLDRSAPAGPPPPKPPARPGPAVDGASSAGAPTDRPPNRRSRGSRLVVAGVVALALAVLAVMLVDRTTGDDDRSNETGPTASPPSADTTSDQNANPSDQDDASNAGPTRDGGNGPGANQTPAPAVPAGQRAATFIDEYFDTVPADLDGGWQMLSPDYQAQTGRGTYDGFWGTVDSVDATEISPQPGGDAVEATVTYSYADGRTVSERQRIYLVDSPDGPRIDGYDTI